MCGICSRGMFGSEVDFNFDSPNYVTQKSHTLPETNNSLLKMDGWNTTFLLGRQLFRVYVKLRGGIFPSLEMGFLDCLVPHPHLVAHLLITIRTAQLKCSMPPYNVGPLPAISRVIIGVK